MSSDGAAIRHLGRGQVNEGGTEGDRDLPPFPAYIYVNLLD